MEAKPKLINPSIACARSTKEVGGTLSIFQYKVSDGQIKSVARKFDLVNDAMTEHVISFPDFYNASAMYEDQLLSVNAKDIVNCVFNLDKKEKGKSTDEDGVDID